MTSCNCGGKSDKSRLKCRPKSLRCHGRRHPAGNVCAGAIAGVNRHRRRPACPICRERRWVWPGDCTLCQGIGVKIVKVLVQTCLQVKSFRIHPLPCGQLPDNLHPAEQRLPAHGVQVKAQAELLIRRSRISKRASVCHSETEGAACLARGVMIMMCEHTGTGHDRQAQRRCAVAAARCGAWLSGPPRDETGEPAHGRKQQCRYFAAGAAGTALAVVQYEVGRAVKHFAERHAADGRGQNIVG